MEAVDTATKDLRRQLAAAQAERDKARAACAAYRIAIESIGEWAFDDMSGLCDGETRASVIAEATSMLASPNPGQPYIDAMRAVKLIGRLLKVESRIGFARTADDKEHIQLQYIALHKPYDAAPTRYSARETTILDCLEQAAKAAGVKP